MLLSVDEKVCASLISDLKTSVLKTGFERIVIGLSGGIDSAVSAALAVKALGKGRVFPYYLPFKDSVAESRRDARVMAGFLSVHLEEIDITPAADAIEANNPLSSMRRGNMLSRLRMVILFDKSYEKNALVLGTGNKSEILLGYMTWYGDSACSINPVGDLYKTQIYQLARILDIPEQIINKAPSADHFIGQSDETDIGYKYSDMDKLFYFMIELGLDKSALAGKGFDTEFVEAIAHRVEINGYKRRMPEIISIGQKKIIQ